MEKKVKVIAFYLPQYHEIPENNQWWGEGFTEWTNVKSGQPLFDGHYQPKVPLNRNYYCLLDNKTLHWQAELAQKYGVYGFCYYHYWFKNGKKLLEKPAEIMLRDESINQKFCFCWANENWARTWDGGNNEVIMPQEYGGEKEWDEHLEYFIPFFKDKRYIRMDSSPVLLIYRPDIITELDGMLRHWKQKIKDYGFDGLVIISQHPAGYFSAKYDASNINGYVMFEPQFTRTIFQGKTIEQTMMRRKIFSAIHTARLSGVVGCLAGFKKKICALTPVPQSAEVNDYDVYWNSIIERKWSDPKLIPGAFVDWDNIARKRNGMLFKNADPRKFKEYLARLADKCMEEKKEFIFINAWNEWGEGAYLEPDEKNGYNNLEAVYWALNRESI